MPSPLVGLVVAIILFTVFGSINRRRKRRYHDDDDSFGGGFGGGGGFFGGGGGSDGGGLMPLREVSFLKKKPDLSIIRIVINYY